MSKQQSRQQDVAEQFLRNNAACEHVLGMFSLFSNKIRFKILCVLKEGDLCVKEIVAVVGGKIHVVAYGQGRSVLRRSGGAAMDG